METLYEGDGSILVPVSPENEPRVREERNRRRLYDVVMEKAENESLERKVVARKSTEARELLLAAITECPIFSVLVIEEINAIINMMELVEREDQEDVFHVGDVANTFYVINTGSVRFVDEQGNRKYQKVKGEFFGELGLLHDNQRRFTVVSDGGGSFWELTREAYRFILMSSSIKSTNRSRQAIRKSDVFSKLSNEQVNSLVSVAKVNKLVANSKAESSESDNFYIVLTGSITCVYSETDGLEESTIQYIPGDFFGDFTIQGLKEQQRQVQVTANEDSECLVISRDDFISFLGPVEAIMNYSERLEVLQTFKLFDTLDPSAIDALATQFSRVFFQDKTRIIGEGDVGTKFYMIHTGLVKVHKHLSVKEVTEVSVLSVGQFFGETSLLLNVPCNADVIAEGPVECYELSLEEFNHLSKPVRDQLYRVLQIRNRRTRQTVARKTVELLESVELKELTHISILGCGKYGLVKLVKTPKVQVVFALKIMQKGRVVADNIGEEVNNERQLLLECDHPFIVKLYRTFQDNSRLYFLMDYVQGGELFTLLHKRGKFVEEEAVFYAACIVEALSYLHMNTIVYRDLKPENTMIDRKGYLRLVDLGFARKIGVKAYTMCGTPQYIAPGK